MVLLLNAVALNVYRAGDDAHPYAHPLAALGCLAVMAGWTAVATWAYDDAARRTWRLLGADLVVTVSAVPVSPWVTGPDVHSSIPGFWVMGALLAWAIHYRVPGGLAAAAAISLADVAIRDGISQSSYGNVFLLMVGGPIVGYMCESLQRMAAERDAAERSAAAAAERARLARAVHDGVLQVLALVQRRGAEIGGDVADLGRLAGEQEAALRTLIRRQDAVASSSPRAPAEARPDLAAELSRLASRPAVTVATPGGPVLLPAPVVEELVAVVAACLDNVAVHVGADAPAWVLLEAFPDRVELSVRDEGPGIPAGRIEQAEREGRLGVAESIRGRIADLGGSARLTTGSSGTEWELVVPREDQP